MMPGPGRFISEDKIKGFTSMPCTLNQYSYCWNRPLDYVDLDGKFPWLIIPVVIGAVMLTGCTAEGAYKSYEGLGEPITDFPPVSEPSTSVRPEEFVDSNFQQYPESTNYLFLSEEEKLFVATVCGESIGQGDLAWRAIANVIMNRVSSKRYPDTVTEVIQQNKAFSSYTDQDPEYIKAMKYLENRTYEDETYEKVISTVMKIYSGDDLNDITQGSLMYFSPKSMIPPGTMPRGNLTN